MADEVVGSNNVVASNGDSVQEISAQDDSVQVINNTIFTLTNKLVLWLSYVL